MYRDLECQHHLVQERYDERPDIPGLTPVGFARWVTLLIQAHPEEEYERLQKAVLEMPISNPDDKKERFPKEISRRLFPRHGDIRIRDHIEDSISEYAAVEPRRSSQEELKPYPHVRFDLSSKSAPKSTFTPTYPEHQYKPYFNTPTEATIDDENPPMPSSPVER